MKSRTLGILLVAALAVCLALALAVQGGQDAATAEIWSDGTLIRTVDLAVDQVFTVESAAGTNVITVSGGKIAVTEASCPDHICMDRGYCSGGLPIVCLPNGLVIQFTGESAVDVAAG